MTDPIEVTIEYDPERHTAQTAGTGHPPIPNATCYGWVPDSWETLVNRVTGGGSWQTYSPGTSDGMYGTVVFRLDPFPDIDIVVGYDIAPNIGGWIITVINYLNTGGTHRRYTAADEIAARWLVACAVGDGAADD